MMKLKSLSLLTSALFASSLMCAPASATVVLFETSMGDFEVNLFDTHTPQTVANFLEYVESESFSESFIHRKMSNFIVQGGGYTYNSNPDDDGEDIGVESIESFGNVNNEPVFSNVRGTIAMAKIGGDADSATSQWFFNLGNNASNLDNQNGGFTAFGTIDAAGLDVIDAINELPNANLGSVFTDTPIQNEPPEGDNVTNEHLVMIEAITVINANKDTQPELPPLSTADNDNGSDDDSSGGGSLNFLMLCALFAGACKRTFKK